MKFSIKDFFGKCNQMRNKLRIWSHLLKKSLMENFFFCPVLIQANAPFLQRQKYQKNFSFLTFSGTIEMKHCVKWV